jgi:hypothetical protein
VYEPGDRRAFVIRITSKSRVIREGDANAPKMGQPFVVSATPRSRGLTHIAMSVAEGTLTQDFRASLVDFYARHFGWIEIESLRLPDRMTLAVGDRDYVNIRERSEPMVCSGYEHVGLLLGSAEAVDDAWSDLDRENTDVHLEELKRGDDGYRSFRFRYLLPLTIEVQYLP